MFGLYENTELGKLSLKNGTIKLHYICTTICHAPMHRYSLFDRHTVGLRDANNRNESA